MEEIANENNNSLISFNNLIIDFLHDLLSTFPEYEVHITQNLDKIKINIETQDYIKPFMKHIKPYVLDISNKNKDIFTNNIVLIENIDFEKIFNSNITDTTEQAIWKYIHSLYLLGNNIISSGKTDMDNVLNFLKDGGDNSLTELSQQAQGLLNIIKHLEEPATTNETFTGNEPEKSNEPQLENLFGDSKIGELAQELAGEINIGDLGLTDDMNDNPSKLLESLMSGDNSQNLMSMIQTVGSKIQNKISTGEVNEEQLLTEAQKMMGSLGNNDLLSGLMKNMGGMGGMGNPPKQNKTRDRLRKKLANKQK